MPQGQSITPHLGKVLDKLIQDYVKERYQSTDEILKDYSNDLLPELNIELELFSFSLVGTWSGKSRTRHHIFVTLCIAKQYGNSFYGNLNVRDVGLGCTYRIKINGEINPKTSEVIIREDEVYSEHWWWKWKK
ncbi:MAG: hypothetical protein RMY28_025915 [Nostoc sp. ChiSLP01]|nr:hypothetical protein [Nostoc sp. CmiSLP01]MDZ8283496.1 hypothetical protein [Nostoc sp. ChiSLP01]